MSNIIVRRSPAQASGSAVEHVVFAEGDQSDPEPRLRRTLQTAQNERGRGVWSDADPEVWIGSTLIGRLHEDGDIEELVQQTVAQFRVDAASLPKLRLSIATLNGLPEQGVRASTGVYLLFRQVRGGDPPRSMADGYTCLRVVGGKDLLGVSLKAEVDQSPRTGATHFSYVVTNLDLLTDDYHRRLYEAFQPIDGDAPPRA